jgi:16S rRNA (guanine527-N7)-methyltransferase
MDLAPDLEVIQARIEDRLRRARVEVPAGVVTHRLAIHLMMVRQWGQAISLTSLRDLDGAVDRHVVESVAASAFIVPTEGRALDIGSGNGYPALPIKCLRPGLMMTLVEPNLRKSVFLKRVAVALGYPDVDVERGRIEDPSDIAARSPLDLITMRGLDRADVVVQGGSRALGNKGQILLFIGKAAADRVRKHLPDSLRVKEISAGGPSFGILVLEKRA